MAGLIKWILVLTLLTAILALCEAQQQEQQLRPQRRRPARDGSARRQRRHRTDKAKLIQHYLKKNGRLEGMIRLVDGVTDFEGIFHSFFDFFLKLIPIEFDL